MSPRKHMRPDEYAYQAADAIRSLNHATLGDSGYAEPYEVDAVIAHLSATVAGMQEVVGQAMRWLHAEHDADRLGHDADADVAVAVGEAARALLRAAARMDRLDDGLREVRRVTAHLKTSTPNSGTEHLA